MFGPVGLKKYADYAKDIHSSGRHLLAVINDILDLSKLEAGKLELRESEVSLQRVAEECMTLVRDRAGKNKVRLVAEFEPNVPPLLCDERTVKQVLLNFLSNAVKFTPPGGQVTLAIRRVADGVAVSVTDTGIGMTKDEIAIALSAFGQVDSKLARKHRGTGLGMPIAKSLVELHGGRMTVESRPKVGTTMAATFPASRIVAKAA
jgi:two-component system cell cycle sensor histidine kinase PleC